MYSLFEISFSNTEFLHTIVLLVSLEGVVSVVTQCYCCVSLVKHCVTALVTLLRALYTVVPFSVDL